MARWYTCGARSTTRAILESYPGRVGLAYDPLGRLWQIGGGSAQTTQFVYDGDKLALEYDGTDHMTSRYAWGPGIDQPIMVDTGGLNCSGTRFLHADYQGSIVAQADCSGNRTAVNTYDDYGIPGSGNVGRFQYTGQAWLKEIGLYYYKARIYSPTLGRFLQTDPIGYKDQINLYAYVANDPVDGTDPSGLYLCGGGSEQCGAFRETLNRVKEAAADRDLSKGDSAKLQSAVNFYGKEGKQNGVVVMFADPARIARESQGKTDTAFTTPTPKGNIMVAITDKFSTLYDKTNQLPQYKGVVGTDERANLVVHEADHGMRFSNGASLSDYQRNVGEWERTAKQRGLLVNQSFGSQSVCQADRNCN